MSLFAEIANKLLTAHIDHGNVNCNLVITNDTVLLRDTALKNNVMDLRVEEQGAGDFKHQVVSFDLLKEPDLIAHRMVIANYGEKAYRPFFKAISGLFVTAFDVCYKVDISTQSYKYENGCSSTTSVKFLGLSRKGKWVLLTFNLYDHVKTTPYGTLLKAVALKDKCYDTFVKKAGLSDWTTLTNAIVEFMNIVPLNEWTTDNHNVYLENLPVGDQVTMRIKHGDLMYWMKIVANPNDTAIGKSIDCLERMGVRKELVEVANTLAFIYSDTKPALSFDVESDGFKGNRLLAHIAKKLSLIHI